MLVTPFVAAEPVVKQTVHLNLPADFMVDSVILIHETPSMITAGMYSKTAHIRKTELSGV